MSHYKSGFPPPDRKLRNWFTIDVEQDQENAAKRSSALLYALLDIVLIKLKEIEKEIGKPSFASDL
jgi:hypothetical protein